MTQDEIIEMARQAECGHETIDLRWITPKGLEAFAKLVAAKEREVVANWIMDKGFATGHGDSIVDLLDQLEWQIAAKEREACAKVCEGLNLYGGSESRQLQRATLKDCAYAIRARGDNQ